MIFRRGIKQTLVATDIVGSTSALLEQGDRGWRETLETHNDIVHHHTGTYRGREAAWSGDGFLLAFTAIEDAVRCACTVSLDIERLRLSIRAAVHHGNCSIKNGTYHGPAVGDTARALSLARAGEVVATEEIVAAVAGLVVSEREVDGRTFYVLDRTAATI